MLPHGRSQPRPRGAGQGSSPSSAQPARPATQPSSKPAPGAWRQPSASSFAAFWKPPVRERLRRIPVARPVPAPRALHRRCETVMGKAPAAARTSGTRSSRVGPAPASRHASGRRPAPPQETSSTVSRAAAGILGTDCRAGARATPVRRVCRETKLPQPSPAPGQPTSWP